MSTVTPNLGLFKYDTTNVTDLASAFNIKTALNNNWDKIDEAISNSGGARNIGEIVTSTIPLTDAGLHLLDGGLIQGDGIYSDFVGYIKNLYEENPPEEGYEKDEIITLPTFSANTQDGITISDARENTTSLQAIFNGTNQSNKIGLWNTYWINIDYGQNTIIDSYTIQADNGGSPEYPSAWTFEGSNNGIDWITLDEKTGITFSLNEIKTFPISTTNVYNQYRIVFSNGVQSSNVGELKQFYTTAYTIKNVFKNSIFAKEAQWQTSVATYGVCGKFVYDSANNTVRLPKYSNKIYTSGLGTAPVKGNGMSLGLTNGTTNFGMWTTNNSENGWVYNNAAYGKTVTVSSSGYNRNLTAPEYSVLGITTDGTKSGIIAQLSDITTALDGYYYIVVATSTKTDIQVDIDEIATDLNGKADTDLSNVPTSKGILTESYINGTSWYRIYSDGWCEQGGSITVNVGSATQVVTFLKPYLNTNYTLTFGTFGQGYGSGEANFRCTAFTSSTCTFYNNSGTQTMYKWEVKGYIR